MNQRRSLYLHIVAQLVSGLLAIIAVCLIPKHGWFWFLIAVYSAAVCAYFTWVHRDHYTDDRKDD